MPAVREIPPEESDLARLALLELRPHLDEDSLAAGIARQRAHGYRLVGSFIEDDRQAAAVAGFRITERLVSGRELYVDDLVTRQAMRGAGHADALFAWLEETAREEGCRELHLDSGVGPERHDAHRFYFRHGLRISSYHFSRRLS